MSFQIGFMVLVALAGLWVPPMCEAQLRPEPDKPRPFDNKGTLNMWCKVVTPYLNDAYRHVLHQDRKPVHDKPY
jgi:hypothetical protein